MNPVALPIDATHRARRTAASRGSSARARAFGRRARACSRAASPSRTARRPRAQSASRRARQRAAGVADVPRDQILHQSRRPRASTSGSRSTIAEVAAAREVAVRVEHVGDAAAHAGGEVAAGPAEHDDAPAGHVLAAVIADALDHRERAAVADGEPLAGDAADVRLAARRAVERDVADDDVLLGDERRVARRDTR